MVFPNPKARILRDGIITDAEGFCKWAKTSGGTIAITAEGDFQGYIFKVFWRKFGLDPVPVYTDDSTSEQLILDKPVYKTLFPIPQGAEVNVQAFFADESDSGSESESDGDTPVANTPITGISIGV